MGSKTIVEHRKTYISQQKFKILEDFGFSRFVNFNKLVVSGAGCSIENYVIRGKWGGGLGS